MKKIEVSSEDLMKFNNELRAVLSKIFVIESVVQDAQEVFSEQSNEENKSELDALATHVKVLLERTSTLVENNRHNITSLVWK